MNHARAVWYLPELKGSPPIPSNEAKTRLMSGVGPPQQGRIRPEASITIFLYNQWHVWPLLNGLSSAASSSHRRSKARLISSCWIAAELEAQFSGG